MYRTGIGFLLLATSTLANLAVAITPLEASLRLQRQIEIAPRVGAIDATGSQPPKEILLPIGDLFDQGETQWCWAFSAYLTLRTYYLNAQSVNAGWKTAIQSLDGQDALKAFLGKHVPQENPDEPARFVRMLAADKTLGADGWTAYMPDDAPDRSDPEMAQIKDLPRRDVIAKLQASLEKGSPVAYCVNPHCIAIYGARYENGEATEYYVADSVGARKYRADARFVHPLLEYILAR